MNKENEKSNNGKMPVAQENKNAKGKKTHNKIDKSNIRENEIVTRDEKLDKRVAIIIGAVATALILIVVLVCIIQWGGDSAKIQKEYPALPKEHVFVYISMEEVETKVANGENFHLYIGSGHIKSANDFVKYIDDYAKSEDFKTDVVYYLRAEELSVANRNYFRDFVSSFPQTITEPIILYFTPTIHTTSTVVSASIDRKLADFSNNYYALLGDYFKDVALNVE